MEIACAHFMIESNLYITFTEEGRVHIWSGQDLSLIWAAKWEGSTREICSSGSRIYGLRNNSCLIWFPIFLMLLMRHSSWMSSFWTLPTISLSLNETIPLSNVTTTSKRSPVEFVSVEASGRMCCAVLSRGELSLIDRNGTQLTTEKSHSSLTITQAVWSKNGDYIASLDISRMLSIRKVLMSSPWLENIGHTRLKELANSMTFLTGTKVLLSASEKIVSAWSFSASLGTLGTLGTVTLDESIWLVNHPHESSQVLGIALGGVYILQCNSRLTCVVRISIQNIPWEINAASTPNEKIQGFSDQDVTSYHISKLVSARNADQILAFLSSSERGQTIILVLAISDIDEAQRNQTRKMRALRYPQDISTSIFQPLGFLTSPLTSGSPSFAFLDKDGWFCTAESSGEIKLHSFLPLDWLDGDNIDKCGLSGEGTLFIPKDDQIGVISHAFRI